MDEKYPFRYLEAFESLDNAVRLLLFEKKLTVPGLMLLFCNIDIYAGWSRPAEKPDVTRSDFISWVESYLLPGSSLECSGRELYGARCGLLHALSNESSLSRNDGVRELIFVNNAENLPAIKYMIRDAGRELELKVVVVQQLWEAFHRGTREFLEKLENDPVKAKLFEARGGKRLISIINDEDVEYRNLLSKKS